MKQNFLNRRFNICALALAAIVAIVSLGTHGLEAPAPAIALAAPECKVEAGVVTITCTTPGALILYSLDNSDPDGRAGPYLAPITLPGGGVVKARAFTADHKQKSALVETKVAPLQADAPRVPTSVVAVTQGRQWPGYDWAKRHAAICAAAKERKPQLVFIGDSITHFFGGEPQDIGKTGGEVWKKYYEPRNVVNLGYGWDRTENVIWRLGEGDEFQGATPKVAVVMIGTNNMGINSAAEIAEGIHQVCALIHKRSPETKILLLGIFPRGPSANAPRKKPDEELKPDANRKKIEEINAMIAKLDGKENVTYLDIGPKFLTADGSITKDMMGDFLHPTKKGYEVWAEAIEPALVKLMGEAAK